MKLMSREEIVKEVEEQEKSALKSIYYCAVGNANGDENVFALQQICGSDMQKFFPELYEFFILETHPRLGWYNVAKKIEELYQDVI